ncbi:MAG TPA: NfeD family protein [Bryobacteraceae bacterium]|jgi:membrane-bound serine protease (ClpP class)|nr:NfeD family protein [Bryobacteraceae bacterium]
MAGVALADPNVAFVLLVLGALGIYWEMHAPGMIAPGVLGVLLICAGAYGLYQDSPSWYGLTLLALAVLLLGIELKYYTHMISGLAGTVLLAIGAVVLLQGPRRITPSLAFAVSAAFGLITIFLGTLAMRARRRRPATGMENLVGEMGTSRTAVDPEGTVFVHGEYWKARSSESIAAGERVRVDKVEDLVLIVRKAA